VPLSEALVFTRREASQILKISTRRLDHTLREVGGVVRFGRAVRIPRELMEQLVREGAGALNARAGNRRRRPSAQS
jgi:hypothetical protein